MVPSKRWHDISAKTGNTILSIAKSYQGTPYGKEDGQVVCNVLVFQSIRKAGFRSVGYFNTSTIADNSCFRAIPPSQLQAGDIVVFNGHHMGIWDPHPPDGDQSAKRMLSATSHGVRYLRPDLFMKKGHHISCYRLQEFSH